MTANPRIVATAPIDDVAIQILAKCGKVEIAADTSEETLLANLESTIGIVVRGEGSASGRVIQQAKDLKVIGRPGVGYDSVDIEAATAKRIPVVFAPGAGATAVAEGALAMLLALVKQIPFWDRAVKAGEWNKRYETKCRDMEGATLGIIGLGRIGSQLARLVRPFQMKVIGADPKVNSQKASEMGVELVGLEELFRKADYISIHAPLTTETKGLVSKERLDLVKPGAILVNTSRGGLVESLDVLLESLEQGQLAAIGLDVFPTEPADISHPIFKHPNCLTAPHAIGMSFKSMENVFKSMAQDMAAVLRGERPRFVVNPEVFSQNSKCNHKLNDSKER